MVHSSLFSTTLAVLGFAFMTRQVMADYSGAYQACTHETSIPSGSYAIYNAMDVDDCQRQCSDLEYVYSLWNGDELLCYCSQNDIEPQDYVDASDSSGTCSDSDYIVSVTVTTYDFNGCYSTAPGEYTNDGSVENMEECLQMCKDVEQAILQPVASQNLLYCYCTTADYPFQQQFAYPCQSESVFYSYSHLAGTTVGQNTETYQPATYPSGLARRQLRERLRQAKEKRSGRFAHCPQPTMACVLPGSTMSFECIDPEVELESCGGCLYGEYNNVTATSTGVDCTSIPGIARGAVTCTRGQCVAFKCEKGYKLNDGSCIRESR